MREGEGGTSNFDFRGQSQSPILSTFAIVCARARLIVTDWVNPRGSKREQLDRSGRRLNYRLRSRRGI